MMGAVARPIANRTRIKENDLPANGRWHGHQEGSITRQASLTQAHHG